MLCQQGIADFLRRFIELKRLHTVNHGKLGAAVIAQKLLAFYFVGTPLFFWHISASLTFHFAAAVPAPIFFPPSLSATISLHLPTHAQHCQTREFLHSTNEILLPSVVVIEVVHPQSACH